MKNFRLRFFSVFVPSLPEEDDDDIGESKISSPNFRIVVEGGDDALMMPVIMLFCAFSRLFCSSCCCCRGAGVCSIGARNSRNKSSAVSKTRFDDDFAIFCFAGGKVIKVGADVDSEGVDGEIFDSDDDESSLLLVTVMVADLVKYQIKIAAQTRTSAINVKERFDLI